jgi:toxin ParE1/3/4
MPRPEISLRAESDIAEIYRYIAPKDPDAALRLVDLLDEAFQRLADFPLLGRERPSSIQGARSIRVRNYVILYSTEAGVVHIHRVVHGRRDIDGLLSRLR